MNSEQIKREYKLFMIDVIREYRNKGYTPNQTFKEMINGIEQDNLSEYELMFLVKMLERKEMDRKVISCENCGRRIELYQDATIKKCVDCTTEELFK